ncbi:MAG TPA: thioredoxin family protein [Verrucomicrobiota bacterium]|nr:thioredoxin family protein [Verrucomicrobiota bacterium]HOK77458.1 thioredoxin family protein [Verrucomicrobiota bacterium]
MISLLVIGPGCARCRTLAQFAEQAAKELGLQYELNKVTDLQQIMALGVMMTPALAINGTIKVVGKVPSVAELKTMLSQAAEGEKSS